MAIDGLERLLSRAAWTAASNLTTPVVELAEEYFDGVPDELLKPLPV